MADLKYLKALRDNWILLAVAGVFVLAVSLMAIWGQGLTAFPRSYFSGILVFEDFNRCGLVRTRGQDFFACEMSSETCGRFRDYANQRIRIAGVEASKCESFSAVQCSREGEFNQKNFKPDTCFERAEFVKRF